MHTLIIPSICSFSYQKYKQHLTIKIKSYTKCYLQFNIKDVLGNNTHSIPLMFVIYNLLISYPI